MDKKKLNFGVDKTSNSSTRSDKEEENDRSASPGVWGSRLRSRGRNVGFGVNSEERDELSGRSKLWGETDEKCKKAVESGVGMNKGTGGEDLMVLKRLRIGKVKEVNSLRDEVETCEEQEEMQGKEEWVVTCGVKEENRGEKEMEVVGKNGGEGVPVLESTPGGENETQIVDAAAKEVVEEEVGTELSNKELESTLGGENETEIVDAAAKGVVEEEDEIELSNKELEVCGGDEIAEVMETTEQSDAEGTQLEIGNNGEIQQKGGNMLEIPQMGWKMEL